MKLAVLSGKGGTGKTMVSVNLAASIPGSTYLDCDVEAPNGRLFFKPINVNEEAVQVKIPVVDPEACTGCRKCIDFCRFNAMAYIGGKVKVFEDICHSCGGCSLLCPTGAISEVNKRIGTVEEGLSLDVKVVTGIMDIGEASGVPVIERLIDIADKQALDVIIDCPPGSACVVMESIKDADFCLIVAEPTTFGVHNMKMVHDLVVKMKKPCAVVINKSYGDDGNVLDYCRTQNIPVIGVIQYDEGFAAMGSEGRIAAREEAEFKKIFRNILERLVKEVGL